MLVGLPIIRIIDQVFAAVVQQLNKVLDYFAIFTKLTDECHCKYDNIV